MKPKVGEVSWLGKKNTRTGGSYFIRLHPTSWLEKEENGFILHPTERVLNRETRISLSLSREDVRAASTTTATEIPSAAKECPVLSGSKSKKPPGSLVPFAFPRISSPFLIYGFLFFFGFQLFSTNQAKTNAADSRKVARVPFWVPVFDPQPDHGTRSAGARNMGHRRKKSGPFAPPQTGIRHSRNKHLVAFSSGWSFSPMKPRYWKP